jgi:hypothetical protein
LFFDIGEGQGGGSVKSAKGKTIYDRA